LLAPPSAVVARYCAVAARLVADGALRIGARVEDAVVALIGGSRSPTSPGWVPGCRISLATMLPARSPSGLNPTDASATATLTPSAPMVEILPGVVIIATLSTGVL
jgi:hypothetical protein